VAADPMHHVIDQTYFEVPTTFVGPEGWFKTTTKENAGKIKIPQPFLDKDGNSTVVIPQFMKSIGIEKIQITKFMILEVVVAILLIAIFIPLARRIAKGTAPKGRKWNFFETLLMFIRDEVARPSIGKKDADKFLPFLWTIFFFVLACNLVGMLPFSGTATSALGTTGGLAAVTFCVTVGAGSKSLGILGFWKAQVPHMGLPIALAIPLIPLIFVIEVVGLFIKHVMLALRLLANMFGGHVVLAVLMSFIALTASSAVWWGVMPATVLGCTAMNMLELFVAFLQAYIFTFLSALFIGAAVHPH